MTDNEQLRTLDAVTACKFGVAESIILHQIQYWIKIKNDDKKKYKDSFHDGKCWVYNSYRAWTEQLPFYSDRTIRRAIDHLIDEGVLIKGNYNKLSYDNTNWYTVNEEVLQSLISEKALGQNDQVAWPNWTDDMAKMDRPIPNTTHDITTKTTSESDRAGNCKDVPDKQEEEFSFSVLDRQIRTVCKDIGKEDCTDSIIHLFHKYYNLFELKTMTYHKRLTNQNITDAIERLSEFYLPANMVEAHNYYFPMMQEYFCGNNNFTGNEKGECDYSILHFISTLEYREYNYEKAALY